MKRTDIKRRPLSDTVLKNLKYEDKDYRELDGVFSLITCLRSWMNNSMLIFIS
jgi:hypothetical protein